MEEGEQALFIPGFNGRYRISTFGDVLDTKRNILLPKLLGDTGKHHVNLSMHNSRTKKHESKRYQLDVLVYKVFNYIKITNKDIAVIHKDGNILNNRLDNLELKPNPYKKSGE